MENKIQQLTDKLYNEGVTRGKKLSEQIIADANRDAAAIIAKAKAEAQEIVEAAKKSASELESNTRTEVSMAERRITSELRSSIETMVISGGVSEDIKRAFGDDNFIKGLITDAVKAWGDGGVSVIVSPDKEPAVRDYLASALDAQIGGGVDVKPREGVSAGFRIEPREGRYYIGFTDEDFKTLFSEYLRPKTAELLFGGK